MTQDVKLARKDDGLFDLAVSNNVLETIDGFETAIIVSLLTDARAPSSSVQTPSRRRGWVGNILTAASGRELGSRLWLYSQSRLTDAVLNELAVAAQESLNWMVEDGIAKSVAASVLKNDSRSVTVTIVITTVEGKEQRYAVLWRRTGEL